MEWWLLATVVGLLVLGAIGVRFFRWLRRGGPRDPSVAGRVDAQGYGDDRWARELSLWRGILRRLQVQAARRETVPEPLARQIAQAEARIAEAERHLAVRQSLQDN